MNYSKDGITVAPVIDTSHPKKRAPDRYDRPAKHDHIVCARCKMLTDVCFEDLTDSLRRRLGGEFLFYDLKVYVLCPACRQETSAPEKPSES